jgi:DNA-binding LacI/PurR family transcriptional regulator
VVVPIGPASGGWESIAKNVATVTIGDALPGVSVAGEVVFDNERGVRESLEHLSALGHRRITVLSWAVESSPDREAERAVGVSAAALGLDCRLVACAYSLNGSRPLALELLGGDERPTAVLCLSDSIAYGVYAACAELGLAIPGDVAVAGFGDHPISRLLAPPLTSTVWDVDRVAELATGFLVTAMDADGPQATLREIVAPQLVTRASTGPGAD